MLGVKLLRVLLRAMTCGHWVSWRYVACVKVRELTLLVIVLMEATMLLTSRFAMGVAMTDASREERITAKRMMVVVLAKGILVSILSRQYRRFPGWLLTAHTYMNDSPVTPRNAINLSVRGSADFR
jgi:heme/copper-type cytochrome/quinol oxidase subunit 3